MRTNQTSVLELYNKGLSSWHVTRYLHSGRCTMFAAVVFCCRGECRVNKRYINHDLTITLKYTLAKLTWNPKMEVWKMMFLLNWMILRGSMFFFRGCMSNRNATNSLSSPRPWRRVVSSLRRGRCLVLWDLPREPGGRHVLRIGPPSNPEVLRRFRSFLKLKSFDLHQSVGCLAWIDQHMIHS